MSSAQRSTVLFCEMETSMTVKRDDETHGQETGALMIAPATS